MSVTTYVQHFLISVPKTCMMFLGQCYFQKNTQTISSRLMCNPTKVLQWTYKVCCFSYICELLCIFCRTILPLIERNSWQSSRHLETSTRNAPAVDPKDEKLQVDCGCCFLHLPCLLQLYSLSSTIMSS